MSPTPLRVTRQNRAHRPALRKLRLEPRHLLLQEHVLLLHLPLRELGVLLFHLVAKRLQAPQLVERRLQFPVRNPVYRHHADQRKGA